MAKVFKGKKSVLIVVTDIEDAKMTKTKGEILRVTSLKYFVQDKIIVFLFKLNSLKFLSDEFSDP